MCGAQLFSMKRTTKTIPLLHSLAAGIAVVGAAGNRKLREGIKGNLVTFPAQVPIFKRVTRPDLQARIVILYFVQGWSMSEIADRYGIVRQRVGQIITQWRIRAIDQGYIQVIDDDVGLSSNRNEFSRNFEAVAQSSAEKEVERSPSSEIAGEIPSSPSRDPGGPAICDYAFTKPRLRSDLLLLEELESIIGILENQLSLRSKQKIVRGSDSCEQLYERARTLFMLLAPNLGVVPTNTIDLKQHHDQKRLKRALQTASALVR